MYCCRLLLLETKSSTAEDHPDQSQSSEHAACRGHDEQVSTEVSALASKDLAVRPRSAGAGRKRKHYNWSSEEMRILERLQNSLLEAVGRMR